VTTPARPRPSAEALVLAAAVPLLCLHARYNPDLDVEVGSTTVSVALSDLAVLAVVAVAARAWRRRRPGALARGRWVWVAAAALVALVLAATLWGPAVTNGYPFADKAVSAAKFLEYALLAPAAAVVLRSREDALALAWSVVLTACAATLVGVLQIVGLVGNLDDVPAGRRMPSFLGYHDFAALSGIALTVAFAALALGLWRRHRAGIALAAAAGVLGGVIAGALATAVALLLVAALALVVGKLRGTITGGSLAAVLGLSLALLAGSLALRSGDIGDFVGFLGADREETRPDIETYSQRTLLAYIGVRIFLDHPLLGAGWQGSELPAAYEPQLRAARERFPDVAASAFPSREHPWGVQNAYVQAAADLGVLGLPAVLAVLAAGFLRAVRRLRRPASPATAAAAVATAGAILVCAAAWAALGLVPGIPTTALLWLALGASVALPRA
jgi:O-antigen ligase